MAWTWNLVGLGNIAILLPIEIALAALVFRTAPSRPQNVRLAFVLLVEAATLVFAGGIVYLTTEPNVAYASQAAAVLGFPVLALAYLWFLASLPAPLARPLNALTHAPGMAAVALALWLAFFAWPERFVRGVAPTGFSTWDGVGGDWFVVLIALPQVLVLLLGLAVALSMWLSAPRRTAARRQGAAYARAFGWRDLHYLGFYGIMLSGGISSWTTPAALLILASYLIYLGLLTYALLKYQLFDIDLRLKWTLRRGALVSVFLAAFFVASAVVEQWLQQYGLLAGGVAVGLMLFALRPIERAADRMAEIALPRVNPEPAYLTFRKVEVYKATLEELAGDGGLSDADRRALETFRRKLGLSADDARAIEADLGAGAASWR